MMRKWNTTSAGIASALLLASGCGGDGGHGAEPNVAALNAELAIRESRLQERLAVLTPDAVIVTVEIVRTKVDECEKLANGLPPDESKNRAAIVSALARFRNGTDAVAAEIAEAETAATNARAETWKCHEGLQRFCEESENGLKESVDEAFLDSWAESFDEIGRQLAGWRTQRLEKMANAEFTTFLAFHAAAVERYDAWEKWIAQAEVVRKELFDRVWPFVSEASSNLAAQAGIARREDGHAVEALERLRRMPVDPGLIDAARDAALKCWDDEIGEAMKAMSKCADETDFPSIARQRAAKCLERANALDADMSAFVVEYAGFLSARAQLEVARAVENAREAHDGALSSVADFEKPCSDLRSDWSRVEADIPEVGDAAKAIRSDKGICDEDLEEAMKKIEALRKRIEEARFVERGAALSGIRASALAVLTSAERDLDAAEPNLATAKTKALADEKAAKWEAEKTLLKDSLSRIKESLERPLSPGYARPEDKAASLLRTVEALLSRIDFMPEDELRSAVGKAQNDQAEIEGETKWTIGTRHPDRPHIFASEEDGKNVWDCDPGYVWEEPGSFNLNCHWSPGRRHPGHPHISAGQTEGTWVPDPGYKESWSGDLDPVWTKGARHPDKPHVFADIGKDGKKFWNCDPGYRFNEYSANSDLSVHWSPGRRHPDHPYVSAGQAEGTWVPDPGFKARWNDDLDPVWTPGTRHPTKPHIFAMEKLKWWDADPGYCFDHPGENCDLVVHWKPGRRHPDYEGIVSAEQEGQWNTHPGWEFVYPGTSDLRTRWVPGARYPGRPHIHASDTKWKWSADEGYDFVEYNSSNLDVRWSPGRVSSDGNRRAGQWEGQFETKRKCPYCQYGYTEKLETCKACNGSGKITAFGRTIPCIPCLGSGRTSSRLPCRRCNGVGWTWQ